MISVKNLYKEFKNENETLRILSGINVEFKKGEKVAIIGPSGSGKSTFLRCLNGLETPTSGEIDFEGINITDPKCNMDEIRKNIGMVFQHFNLFPHLTILQNITLAPVSLKLYSKRDAEQCALALLEKVGLRDKADSYPSRLSGGQKQRVAIIRALIMNPKVILFDEPTASVDVENEEQIKNALEELAKNHTIMTIAHRLNTIENAECIYVLQKGRIVQKGTHRELMDNEGVYSRLYRMSSEEEADA